MQDAGRVMRDAAGADSAPRGEVAAAVEDDLVAAHRSVRIGAGDRVGVEVERPGHEAADQRAARRERAVHRRRQVHLPDARLKAQDREGPGIDRAVPPDDVQRRALIAKAVERPVPLDQQIAQALLERSAEVGAAKIPVAVRGVHAQLADLVAPLPGQAEAGGALDAQPVLRPRFEQEAVGQPARHEQVVTLLKSQVAERRAQRAAAREDEVEIVAVAVGEVHRVGQLGKHHRDRDVGIEEQRHARVDGRPASAPPEGLRAIVPAHQPR